jgi:FkbM family methyltransferase
MITVFLHRDVFDDIKKVVPKCTNIVDGGSFHGGTVEALSDAYPNAEVYCFEPITTQHLRSNLSKNKKVRIFPYALGDSEGVVTMRVGTKEETSSINPITAEGVAIYGTKVSTQATVSVPMRTLDSILSCAEIIKLDVHGFELAALRGATKLLQTTTAILIEVCFVPLFEGQPLFTEINTFMYNNSFRVYNIYHLSSTTNGQLICADILYVRHETD